MNMTPEDIKGLVAHVLSVDLETLNDDSGFGNPPQWDSAGHMFLIITLEEKLGRTLDNDEIVALTNIRSIISFISGQI